MTTKTKLKKPISMITKKNITIYYLVLSALLIAIFGLSKMSKYDDPSKAIIGNEPVRSSVESFTDLNLKSVSTSDKQLGIEEGINLDIKDPYPSDNKLQLRP